MKKLLLVSLYIANCMLPVAPSYAVKLCKKPTSCSEKRTVWKNSTVSGNSFGASTMIGSCNIYTGGNSGTSFYFDFIVSASSSAGTMRIGATCININGLTVGQVTAGTFDLNGKACVCHIANIDGDTSCGNANFRFAEEYSDPASCQDFCCGSCVYAIVTPAKRSLFLY